MAPEKMSRKKSRAPDIDRVQNRIRTPTNAMFWTTNARTKQISPIPTIINAVPNRNQKISIITLMYNINDFIYLSKILKSYLMLILKQLLRLISKNSLKSGSKLVSSANITGF